jgi:hypothetical protein
MGYWGRGEEEALNLKHEILNEEEEMKRKRTLNIEHRMKDKQGAGADLFSSFRI